MSKRTNNKSKPATPKLTKTERAKRAADRKAQSAENAARDKATRDANRAAKKAEAAKPEPTPKVKAKVEVKPEVLAHLPTSTITTTARAAAQITAHGTIAEGASVGYTIQKERPSANNVTRASIGTACERVWSMCDTLQDELKRLPTIGEAREYGEKLGLNKNNIAIEFYRWRKFQGVRGRAA